MGTKGFKFTDEQKKRMSLSHKGHRGYWKGKKLSAEHRQKMAQSMRGKLAGKSHPFWNGGRIEIKGRIYIHSPNHPAVQDSNKYISEHRLVMEKHLGRYLRKGEVVHHINGISNDNRIENLRLFKSTREHTKFHHDNPNGGKYGNRR